MTTTRKSPALPPVLDADTKVKLDELYADIHKAAEDAVENTPSLFYDDPIHALVDTEVKDLLDELIDVAQQLVDAAHPVSRLRTLASAFELNVHTVREKSDRYIVKANGAVIFPEGGDASYDDVEAWLRARE